MGRHDEKRRSYGEEKERSPQRYRESAEERGLAAAARLAAAVAAATHGDPKFRLRRHSAIGCSPSSPQAPFHAWKEPKEKSKETPKENGRRCEHDERRDERPERPERQRRASPTRPPRAQSARRPARLDPPARARSADPRRRYEAAFVPEGTEEVAAEVPPVLEFKAPAPPSTAGTAQSPRHAARRSTGHTLTAAVNAAAGRRSCTNMSVMDQQPKPFKNLSSKIFSGAYIMEKFLGRGASASVWEAIRSDNHQRVAVKVFDQGQRDKRQAHREMKVLARVRHPRIVQAFEVVETPRLAQLVCELVDGESLRAFAHRQPSHKLSEQAARQYYHQVVDGVNYCHDHLVAHRDLKLENLLLDKSREGVKIIDFGFAAHVPNKDTKLKAFCGTPSYMAPEIIRGEGYSGFAADVWALGVVIFALLSGTLPFAAKTEMQLYARIRRGMFTFPDCFGEIQKRLIRGVMKKDAAARPSAAALLQHAWVAGKDSIENVDPSSSVSFACTPQMSPRHVKAAPAFKALTRPQTAPRTAHGHGKCVTSHVSSHVAQIDLVRKITTRGPTAFGGS